ncbi:D-alanine--D-alanine ligase family protein [Mycetocola zhujimingii]|uniref:D-alanine--D-alanine ligase family protein n=1 Tax=Mycetocola zhujimingii TaxID=2079792 RepID=UPI000D3B1B52|nr:D-alanine--D-alanine ligase family protein [Mycetocola zhujimingii]AWB86766.1 D-alanine--D-alanine ligase [Mycetocola zhujimingii]
MTQKRLVVVLFGGRSSEHSISCATAGGVLRAIDRSLFDIVPVGITRDGVFVLEQDDPDRFALDKSRLPEVVDNGTRVRWPDSATSRELTVTADGVTTSLGNVDMVFPILHGPFGEDGTLQGMLELIDMPYVGSGVLASALGMDKHFTKTVLEHAGITVAPWRTVSQRDYHVDDSAAFEGLNTLGAPVFVKPARAGSSVGVSKVTSPEQLDSAMRTAFAEDDKVLIEKGMPGREVEIAVLGGRPGEPARASVAGEIMITGRDFYDFDAKYLDAPGIELVCPADIDADTLAALQSIALRAFDAIGAEGLARVDFFLTEDGIVVNEVNTMPGFTPISMFPSCWIASGLSYADLITELIDVAHARRAGALYS